jgi:transcriptional regulator with XRE-family HTH domain
MVCPSPGGRCSYPGNVSSRAPHHARVIQLRPVTAVAEVTRPARTPTPAAEPGTDETRRILQGPRPVPVFKEPLWRHIVGDVLRRERLAQERRLRDVADEARISMPYLSEVERGRKEASSEVLAAAAHALGLSLADLLTLAQDELARLTQPAQLKRADRRDHPSRAITPAQPAPKRDIDAETTVSPDDANTPPGQPSSAEAIVFPDGGNVSAGQPSSAEAIVFPDGANVSAGQPSSAEAIVFPDGGNVPAGQPSSAEAIVFPDGGNVPPGRPTPAEARLASAGIGPAGVGVAGEDWVPLDGLKVAEVDVAGEAWVPLGDLKVAEVEVAGETGLSSWQVKLSLAA